MVEIGWRRTWPDEPDREDYIAIDGDRAIGRAHANSGHYHAWYWFWGGVQGVAASRREAFLGLEAHYEAARTALGGAN